MVHEPWAMACTAATEAEAALVAGFLDSRGIPAKIEARSFRQEPVNFGALAQIRLFVAPEQLTAARQLLEERQRRFTVVESPGDAEPESHDAAGIDEDAPGGELEQR